MEIALTGQKDVDLFTLNKLDDRSLLSFCIVNQEANEFCSKYDSELWRNRFIKKYGEDAAEYKSPGKTWKQFFLQILKYWDDSKKDKVFYINRAMADAAKGGHKDVIDFFISKGADKWDWGLQEAASGGHKDLINFFISKGSKDWYSGIEGAAEGGHKDLIDFFISKGSKGPNLWNRGMEGAARGGHKDLVDFFISKGAYDWQRGLTAAARGGHKDLVDFFISNNYVDLEDLQQARRYAEDGDHYELIKYLRSLIRIKMDEDEY